MSISTSFNSRLLSPFANYKTFTRAVKRMANEGNTKLDQLISNIKELNTKHSKAILDLNDAKNKYQNIGKRPYKVIKAYSKRKKRLALEKGRLKSIQSQLQDDKYGKIIASLNTFSKKYKKILTHKSIIKAEIQKLNQNIEHLLIEQSQQLKKVKKHRKFFRKKSKLTTSLIKEEIKGAFQDKIIEKQKEIKKLSGVLFKLSEEVDLLKKDHLGSDLSDEEFNLYYNLLDKGVDNLADILKKRIVQLKVEAQDLAQDISQLTKEIKVLKPARKEERDKIVLSNQIIDDKRKTAADIFNLLSSKIKELSDIVGLDTSEMKVDLLASRISQINLVRKPSEREVRILDYEPERSLWKKIELVIKRALQILVEWVTSIAIKLGIIQDPLLVSYHTTLVSNRSENT